MVLPRTSLKTTKLDCLQCVCRFEAKGFKGYAAKGEAGIGQPRRRRLPEVCTRGVPIGPSRQFNGISRFAWRVFFDLCTKLHTRVHVSRHAGHLAGDGGFFSHREPDGRLTFSLHGFNQDGAVLLKDCVMRGTPRLELWGDKLNSRSSGQERNDSLFFGIYVREAQREKRSRVPKTPCL